MDVLHAHATFQKGDLKQCANYRTVALVSHASKILLRIILQRIRAKTETEIADEQVEFRHGRGTKDQIPNVKILLDKARARNHSLCDLWTSSKHSKRSPVISSG